MRLSADVETEPGDKPTNYPINLPENHFQKKNNMLDEIHGFMRLRH